MTRKEKKSLNKKVTIVAATLIMLLVFTSFVLVKEHNRTTKYRLNNKLVERTRIETKGMDVHGIIQYSLDLTSAKLRFSRYNDIENGKANCVGYAKMCAEICNYGLRANNIDGSAHSVVGHIESGGINWCKVAQSLCTKQSHKNFVKNHDFVELTTKTDIYMFDPSMYDVLGVSCLSHQSRN